MGEVRLPAGQQAVDARHAGPVADERVDRMRADEAGTAGDEDSETAPGSHHLSPDCLLADERPFGRGCEDARLSEVVFEFRGAGGRRVPGEDRRACSGAQLPPLCLGCHA